MSNTILVVEDDAGLREALIDTLEMSGIECVAASSAEQAMLLLKKRSIFACCKRRANGRNEWTGFTTQY